MTVKRPSGARNKVPRILAHCIFSLASLSAWIGQQRRKISERCAVYGPRQSRERWTVVEIAVWHLEIFGILFIHTFSAILILELRFPSMPSIRVIFIPILQFISTVSSLLMQFRFGSLIFQVSLVECRFYIYLLHIEDFWNYYSSWCYTSCKQFLSSLGPWYLHNNQINDLINIRSNKYFMKIGKSAVLSTLHHLMKF